MQHFETYAPVEYSNGNAFVEFFSVLILGSLAASELYLLGKSFYNNILEDSRKKDKESTEVDIIDDAFNDLISDNRQVIIVRSVPGAGRRQLISELAEFAHDETSVVCDINDYFTKNGKYNFRGKDISKAEDYCLMEFVKAIKNETDLIFVSGHFYEKWMYNKYIEIANLAGYEHRVVSIECRNKSELKKFNERSTHNVPYSRSLKIYENWENDINEVEFPTFNENVSTVSSDNECLIVTSSEDED